MSLDELSNPGDFYLGWLKMARREIVDEYERTTGQSFPAELNELADKASDTAVHKTPRWIREGGSWILYFNGQRFGDK